MQYLISVLLLGFTLSTTAQIKVMSYNIRNSNANDGVNKWSLRRQALAQVILNSDPDVLGTQEVLEDQRRDLKKLLPAYDVFGAGRNNGRHAGEHSTIFYKRTRYAFVTGGNFWLSQTPLKPGSKSWDAAITRICTWVKLKDKQTNEDIYFFNTHFDHRGQQARVKSAALLRAMIDSMAGDKPVVVTGDFNFTPYSEGYTTMTQSRENISLTDAYTPDAPDYTACGFAVSNHDCSRIDYVFYSKHFIQDQYTLHTDNNGTCYPSDHLTISVALKLKR